jgi:simple sugar transport system permease protein
MDDLAFASILASGIRLATPLVLCALAGLLSERAGVVDIGLEGKMLFAAFAAGAVGAASGSTLVAIAAAMALGVVLSCLHGLACVSYPGDQVVSGVAINIIAAGLTVVLGIAWFAQGGQTPPLSVDVRVQAQWQWPAQALQGIPWAGPFIGQVLLGHSLLVYCAYALVPAVWYLVYRTRFGLRLRAVGENPHMVDAAGVSVQSLRYRALMLNGALCGLAGAYLVLAQSANFSPHMTAGRGFMALAALIFGRWKPWSALGACLLFGLLDAIAMRLQGVDLPGLGQVPVQAIQALPYVMTVVLLAGFVGRAVPPAALGKPYVKQR